MLKLLIAPFRWLIRVVLAVVILFEEWGWEPLQRVMAAIGRLHKVLPTAVVANAMRPSITRKELESRADAVIDALRSAGANMGVESGAQAIEAALEPLEARGIIVAERGRVRVRDRNVLRYYARTLDHLLASPLRRTH